LIINSVNKLKIGAKEKMSNVNKVLDCLTTNGSMTQIELRKCTGFSPTYMSHLLKDMEKNGLIIKREETIDNPNNKGGKTVTNRISLISQVDNIESTQQNQDTVDDDNYLDDDINNADNSLDTQSQQQQLNLNQNELTNLHLKVDLLEKRVSQLEEQLEIRKDLAPNTQAYKDQKLQEQTEMVYNVLDDTIFKSAKELAQLTTIKIHDIRKILKKLKNIGKIEANYPQWNNPNKAYRRT